MNIKPELEPQDWTVICKALKAFALLEMERVNAMAASDERSMRALEAGYAAGLRARIETAMPKEDANGH